LFVVRYQKFVFCGKSVVKNAKTENSPGERV